ncbi:Rhs family protein [Salmonella enterica subsp. enterica]|uniref:Rhs family protein n=1 Tax=Salmonella enterica I TaxID=59201 RepID=A0A3S5DN86_SALET|nr:Rhs family protein [Salmonella enterica subsp. enterica]
MLTPGHQIFDPEEQLYLSRLHDGRYVLHYTDRSYYVFGDFDSDGMAYLLFMETPHRQRHCLRARRRQTGTDSLQQRASPVTAPHTDPGKGSGCRELNLVAGRQPVAIWWSTGMTITGQLTGVVNRAGTQVRQFAYENGLMTAHSNAAGFTCRYRWQELDGAPRVTEHDTSDGEHYRFDYDFARRHHHRHRARQGESWQWWYDRETYIHRAPDAGRWKCTASRTTKTTSLSTLSCPAVARWRMNMTSRTGW